MTMIRFATRATTGELPACWLSPAWAVDTPLVRQSLEILVRIGNTKLGEGTCWIETRTNHPASAILSRETPLEEIIYHPGIGASEQTAPDLGQDDIGFGPT